MVCARRSGCRAADRLQAPGEIETAIDGEDLVLQGDVAQEAFRHAPQQHAVVTANLDVAEGHLAHSSAFPIVTIDR